jgi:hypothetical protein
MNQLNGDAQAVIDTVERLSGAREWAFQHPQRENETIRVMVLPTKDGVKAVSVKPFLDEYLDRPEIIDGKAKAETLTSFCDMVNYHKTLATAIFAAMGGPSLEAVIDYHGCSKLGAGSEPAWCQHRIGYAFPKSPEFKKWEEAAKWRGQSGFVQFLDGARFDLVDPLDIETIPVPSILNDVLLRHAPRDKRSELGAYMRTVFASPSDLMQLVESLSGHSKTRFAEVRTDRFGNMRATIEKEGRVEGDEKIPSLFLVSVAAFVGGDPFVIPARIRARVEAGGLQLSAELVGLDRVLADAFEASIKEVEANTSIKVFRGACEA